MPMACSGKSLAVPYEFSTPFWRQLSEQSTIMNETSYSKARFKMNTPPICF
jgi:hypothetical protein